jgi:hypothetical protein
MLRKMGKRLFRGTYYKITLTLIFILFFIGLKIISDALIKIISIKSTYLS